MFRQLTPALNERSGRLWAAGEAMELGWGGVSAAAQATGLSPTTIRAGIVELKSQEHSPATGMGPERVRRRAGDLGCAGVPTENSIRLENSVLA